MFVHGGSGKMPFQDSVVAYLESQPGGATVEDCARAIGISPAAVNAVLTHLEAMGLVEYPSEQEAAK